MCQKELDDYCTLQIAYSAVHIHMDMHSFNRRYSRSRTKE